MQSELLNAWKYFELQTMVKVEFRYVLKYKLGNKISVENWSTTIYYIGPQESRQTVAELLNQPPEDEADVQRDRNRF